MTKNEWVLLARHENTIWQEFGSFDYEMHMRNSRASLSALGIEHSESELKGLFDFCIWMAKKGFRAQEHIDMHVLEFYEAMSNDTHKVNPAWVTAPYRVCGLADEALIKILEKEFPADKYKINTYGPDEFGLYFYDVREIV